MAIFPQGMTRTRQNCNTGERRVFDQIKRCLTDDYIVWHNIPIGILRHEPDFVILNPRRGVLVLEVKDWKKSTMVDGNSKTISIHTENGVIQKDHPDHQARRYAMAIDEVLGRDKYLQQTQGRHKGKSMVPYGWGTVLSHLQAKEIADTNFAEIFAPHKTLLRDDLLEEMPPEQFEERLWSMFVIAFPVTLTLPQQDRVRWHLFPNLRITNISAAQKALAEQAGRFAIPDLIHVMDLQQEAAARTIGDGHRVIHGPAGSGKTMILVFRAQQLAEQAAPDSKPILVLCYNRPLADRIAHMLHERGVEDSRVTVRTFHAWCGDMLRSYQLPKPTQCGDAYFAEQVEIVQRHLQNGMVPSGQYAALLIDEGHDFDEHWLKMAVTLVDADTKSLLLLYDDAQSIYQKQKRQFSFSSVGIQAQGRTSIMKFNYRNTAEILAVAIQCADKLLNKDGQADSMEEDSCRQSVFPLTAGRRGSLPCLIQAKSHMQEVEIVCEKINNLLSDGVLADDIAVLCRTRKMLQGLEKMLKEKSIACQSRNDKSAQINWKIPGVKLLTMHASKGLEFMHVFLAGAHEMPLPQAEPDDEVRLLYVAMTRATHSLTITCHADSPMVQRIRQSIAVIEMQQE